MCMCPGDWIYWTLFSTLPQSHSFRKTLMSELRDIDSSLVSRNSSDILSIILYGDKRYNPCTNKIMLTTTIKYIKNTQRFDQPLFWTYKNYPFHLFFFCFLFICLFVIADMNVIFFSLTVYVKIIKRCFCIVLAFI